MQQILFEAPPPELSFAVKLEEITNINDTVVIDASALECAALAERFDLPYIRNLSAEVSYRRTRNGQTIRIDGRITANYGQICGITVTPMPMTMEDSFITEYTLSAWEKVSEFDLDQPEVLVDDHIDMGEVVAQYFGLGIDPYAHKASAGAETLDNLVESIAEVVGALAAAPAEAMALDFVDVQQEESETESLAAAGETIQEMPPESLLPEVVVAAPEPAKTYDSPPESLFFKYLRQMQSR